MLEGRGFDPYHPVAKIGAVVESNIAIDFLRQQAWSAAEEQFIAETTIDRAKAVQLRKGNKPLGFRKVGIELGLSHERVRQIMEEERMNSKPIYQRLKRR